MAHTALHFTVGMVVGMVALAPRVRAAFQTRRHLAPAIRQWLAAAWGLGVFAVIPSLLGFVGLSPGFCSGWWMNLFLFHPLLNSIVTRGMIAGGFGLVACFVLQYACIVAAIVCRGTHDTQR